MNRASGPPAIEAHRGDPANAPENTLAAFEAALRLGVPWIELDVHPAADGTLVVIHDDTIDRTTDGSGAVCDLTVDALRRLDAGSWFAPRFAGERIPQLVEVLELVAPAGTRLNVEIKTPPAGFRVAPAVVDLLRRFGKAREYVVSSFDLPALLQVQAIAPEIALALIGRGPEILEPARHHGLAWIHAHHATLDEGIVVRAHAAGLGVDVWTVDDPRMLATWTARGVDKLCTNRPAAMLAEAEGGSDDRQ
jgi:glycerophosphoryl diester phosphodiesterase